MVKAALYCRLSEEDRDKAGVQDDSRSIQNQKSMLRQYALEHGWEVISIYSDDDYGGSDRNRPEFRRLISDAEKGKFDVILCKTQSRFTRELELVEKYIHGLFPLWGIRFVSIVDNADTDNKGNKKSRQINGLVNEWYLEDMSDNIRSVLTSRREMGYHIGSFAPYGYQKDPQQRGHLIPDPEAAGVVRRIFALFSQGHGKTAIARMLNQDGIPNPTEYKRLAGLRYRSPTGKTGSLWKYPSIAHILTNEVYLGNLVQGRYGSESYKTRRNRPKPKEQWIRAESTHEPIIEQELWDQVQTIITEQAKPFTDGSIGLFARKARCMFCGCVMRSTKSRGRHYLRCSSRYISREACPGTFLSVDRLEQIVRAEIERLSQTYLDVEELTRSLASASPLPTRQQQLLQRRAALQSRLDGYRRGMEALYLDRGNGLLTEEDFAVLSQRFFQEREHLARAAEELDRRLAATDQQSESDGPEQKSPVGLAHPDHLTREMVEWLIDYILVGGHQPGEKDPTVEIHWNF